MSFCDYDTSSSSLVLLSLLLIFFLQRAILVPKSYITYLIIWQLSFLSMITHDFVVQVFFSFQNLLLSWEHISSCILLRSTSNVVRVSMRFQYRFLLNWRCALLLYILQTFPKLTYFSFLVFSVVENVKVSLSSNNRILGWIASDRETGNNQRWAVWGLKGGCCISLIDWLINDNKLVHYYVHPSPPFPSRLKLQTLSFSPVVFSFALGFDNRDIVRFLHFLPFLLMFTCLIDFDF